ncbi:TPA: hypothetical protein PTV51_002184 [Clostridium botulinum]|nr:hypothetical protein [Clostridium botulinum]HDK7201454.1 hypothetical protein [Clostridium botulinum]
MCNRKANPEHIKKAYNEIVDELKEQMDEKEKAYEDLEVSRIKYEMNRDLNFIISNDDKGVDTELINNIYLEEKKIEKDILALDNRLEKCEEQIKKNWIK